ncbi:pimeloyl-ACP methyl ester carboxylesterase [Thermosporothrix hazakensis]|jgi:pimeloyl-ACP methyl ester carboxylesterase|uniref:Pimeloyl-ACP methyl ester carboxylesterase n=1 Tax=Thermosporothrix hazakensis TaxID=644383 RepID=A0A326UMJ7_THEHA|nr:alpha/beta hydrolase [Thermosporothrix hazakensis]PZW34433.1 pimeloyl-ACP methyl ester carboxylesterase [Thermosporothrix hazakensis]GCE46018.1 hypothetical protein KTH_08870 [Thermosporothrix hazakensis]
MTAWSKGTVQVNDLTIHYHRTGGEHKPKMLLLHGVMDNGLCWTPVARDLQDQFDIIMPDARGHGETQGSIENASFTTLANDVAGLVQALNLEKPYLFGHSMGAMTALAVAALYPELPHAILLEDPPFWTEQAARSADVDNETANFMKTFVSLRELPWDVLLAKAREFNPKWDEVELEPWAQSKRQFAPDIMEKLTFDLDWQELLPRVACPILLLTGDVEEHAITTPEGHKRHPNSGRMALWRIFPEPDTASIAIAMLRR